MPDTFSQADSAGSIPVTRSPTKAQLRGDFSPELGFVVSSREHPRARYVPDAVGGSSRSSAAATARSRSDVVCR
jgi:hypothetical protein